MPNIRDVNLSGVMCSGQWMKSPAGCSAIVGYTGRLRPKGVPSLSSQYIKLVGKIVILVFERVTKFAAKWKRWRLKPVSTYRAEWKGFQIVAETDNAT